jgi:hypothetical protein
VGALIETLSRWVVDETRPERLTRNSTGRSPEFMKLIDDSRPERLTRNSTGRSPVFISASKIDIVKNYIMNQPEHHRKVSLQDEE